jgi:hypothetical protein
MVGKTLYIDFDTCVYSSAAQQQNTRILTLDTISKQEEYFKGKKEFNIWCKANERKQEEFLIRPAPELTGSIEYACKAIKDKFNNILAASGCNDYYVCIQGAGNFRNDIKSDYVAYKGQRAAKPLLFQECFDYTKRKFGSRCIVTEGMETDDFVCAKQWESYIAARTANNKEAAPYVIAYVDKDIPANAPGAYLNYYKLEDGVFWVDSRKQAYNFLHQTLLGDACDNIPGILKVSEEIRKLYKLRSSGCGVVAARTILGEGLSVKTMAERVVEAYRSTWEHDWRERLTDNCKFLYLQRYAGDVFDLDKYFDNMGVVL